MREIHVRGGIKEFNRVLKKDIKALERQIAGATRKTARQGAAHVRRNVPVAFSQLRDSVHTEGSRIVVDSPHAASAEVGSRPHMPPLAPLIAWVRLRGMQGLASQKQIARMPGKTTRSAATRVSATIAAASAANAIGSGASAISGGSSSPAGPHSRMDVVVQIARAIQRSIARKGTKPHWYMRESLPAIVAILDQNVRQALERFHPGAVKSTALAVE